MKRRATSQRANPNSRQLADLGRGVSSVRPPRRLASAAATPPLRCGRPELPGSAASQILWCLGAVIGQRHSAVVARGPGRSLASNSEGSWRSQWRTTRSSPSRAALPMRLFSLFSPRCGAVCLTEFLSRSNWVPIMVSKDTFLEPSNTQAYYASDQPKVSAQPGLLTTKPFCHLCNSKLLACLGFKPPNPAISAMKWIKLQTKNMKTKDWITPHLEPTAKTIAEEISCEVGYAALLSMRMMVTTHNGRQVRRTEFEFDEWVGFRRGQGKMRCKESFYATQYN